MRPDTSIQHPVSSLHLKIRILRFLYTIFASVFSGVLLFLAFPRYDLGFLAWVGLVPLLLSMRGKGPKEGFSLSWTCGLVFFAGAFSWIYQVPGYNSIHHALIIPYLGLYFAVFGLGFSLISKRWGIVVALWAAPFLWVSLEYLRSTLGFLSLPWALLGHSQYRYPPIIQVASFTGAYGISFLIVLVNAALAAVLLNCLGRLRAYRHLAASVVVTFALVGFVLSYGYMILGKSLPAKTIRISVVQANVDQEMKNNPKKYAKPIMQKHVDLTHKVAQDNPRLIVWPEGATPGFVLKNMSLLNQIRSLVREKGAYFVIGSSEYPKFIKEASYGPQEFGNTAIFFSPGGKVLGQYLKIRLVPFGEYIPLEKTVPWPRFIVPDEKKSFEVPGNEFTLFQLDGTRFGVLICWEIVFPDLCRGFAKKGANFMINITNEGWFGESAAPYQMAAINVFRAVENRIAVARAANTGISCFIDPFGRITGKVRNSGKDSFVEGYLTQEIVLADENTFYTRHGDLFVYAILLVSVLIVGASLIVRMR